MTSEDNKGYPSRSYRNMPQPGNPRYTEAWALVEAARRMTVAVETGTCNDISPNSEIRQALRLNWRLWTIFQTELSMTDEPQVPLEIRQNMLSLCNFVDKHTIEALEAPDPAKVNALIGINRNIASGLLNAGQDGAAPQAGPAAEDKNRPSDAPIDHSV